MQLAIQRPAPESRLSRISKAHITNYENFDKDHIKDEYPRTDQTLIDRFGYAISKRRAILKRRADERSKPGKESFGNIREKNMARRATEGFERIKGRDFERTIFSLNSLGVAL